MKWMMMAKAKSTKRLLGAMVLSFESFAAFFATLAGFGLKVAPAEWVWTVGLSVSILCILTPGLLGRRGGYELGWLLQLPFILSGFWLWGMFIIGTIFAGLWAWAMVAGGTIDKARENLDRINRESGN